MRILSTFMILTCLLTGAALAQEEEQAAPDIGQQLAQEPTVAPLPGTGSLAATDPRAARDALFEKLRRESNPEQAKALAGQIRTSLNDSGSATVNLLMSRAAEAIAANRSPAAFDYLDQVIVLKPDYTEGWNLRATLHFALGNHRKSVADIGHVLALEPRHLGALSGLAGIMMLEGRDEAALRVFESYLKLYPADRAAQDQARDLLEKLAGSRT